jgi:hypothetical protein
MPLVILVIMSHDSGRQSSGMIKADYVRRNPDHAGEPGLPDRPA